MANASGVVALDGKMIDMPIVTRAKDTLAYAKLLEKRFKPMNEKAMEIIRAVPGWENKEAFAGAYACQPKTQKLAPRPLKTFRPGQTKVHDLAIFWTPLS